MKKLTFYVFFFFFQFQSVSFQEFYGVPKPLCNDKTQERRALAMGISPQQMVLEGDKVRKLFLQRMNWQDLPKDFFCFEHLVVLDLSGNAFTAVPFLLLTLPKLQELWMNSNQISSFPVEFTMSKSLRLLSLSNNELRKIPTALCYARLKKLYLQKNELHHLPSCLLTHLYLEELHISGNPIHRKSIEKKKKAKQLQVFF